MPHSDCLAWLSSATLKNFISGVLTRILMLLKANLVYSFSRLRSGPQIIISFEYTCCHMKGRWSLRFLQFLACYLGPPSSHYFPNAKFSSLYIFIYSLFSLPFISLMLLLSLHSLYSLYFFFPQFLFLPKFSMSYK